MSRLVAQTSSQTVRPGEFRLPPPRVLRTFIVEDSPVILDNLISVLEAMSPVRVVGHAADEWTALDRIADHQDELDLVIVDIFLRTGSGLGVLRGALQANVPAPRVVLSNCATVDMRAQCMALGATRVFDKSNDLADLLAFCSRLAANPG